MVKLIALSLLAVTVTGVKLALRGKTGKSGSRAIDAATLLTVPGFDSVSAPDSYSGVTYDSTSNRYSLDVGGTATRLANDPTQGGVLSAPIETDYGMVNLAFQPPSTSYTSDLAGYTAPARTVVGCRPSGATAQNTNCLPGSSTYNLQIPRVFPAVN